MNHLGKYSSASTILALSNAMIGAPMLLLPLQFVKSGIFSSLIVLSVTCFICFKTSRVYVVHLAPSDNDPRDIIGRILGVRWQKCFQLVSGYYLLIVNLIIVDLINDQTYELVYFIMKLIGQTDYIVQNPSKQLIFNKMSIQYMSMFYFLPLLGLVALKNVDFIVKVVKYGAFSILAFIAFILYEFIAGLVDDTINFQGITYWSWNIGELTGTAAVAFAVHSSMGPIIKRNLHSQHNQRDLGLSFIISYIFYLFVGVVGMLVVLKKKQGYCSVTIINCFRDEWSVLFVQITYLFSIITVLPCLFAISRRRILHYHFPQNPENKNWLFNLIFVIIASTLSFFSPYISINLFVSVSSSILGFFFIYALPTRVHIQCLLRRKIYIFSEYNDILHDIMRAESLANTSFTTHKNNECPHPRYEGGLISRSLRLGFYVVINLLGFANAVNALYLIYYNIVKE